MNYKEDKNFRKSFESFVCIRLLQNINRKNIELDKIFSECLTKVFGITSFETLKKIGLSIDKSISKLHPEFLDLYNQTKAKKPNLKFEFILADNVKPLKVNQMSLKPTNEMVFYQNLFHDFYYKYFNSTYKKCEFSFTLGTMEVEMKQGGKCMSLHVFPVDGLILMELGKSRGMLVKDLWKHIQNTDKADDEKLFLSCLENLVKEGILNKETKGFSKLMSEQLTFDCFVKVNKSYFKKFKNNSSKLLINLFSKF
jgi:ribosomal protein L23